MATAPAAAAPTVPTGPLVDERGYITAAWRAYFVAADQRYATLFQNTGGTIHGNIGFYGHAPMGKPTVSGAKAGNTALASLVAALAGMGLVTDATEA